MKWFWFPDRDATTREIRWQLWGSVGTTSLLTSGRSTRIFLVEKDASSKQPARCAVCVTTTPLPLQARFPDGLLHKTFISSWLCASGFSINISLGSRSKKIHAGERSKKKKKKKKKITYLCQNCVKGNKNLSSFDQVDERSRQHGCVPSGQNPRPDLLCGCYCICCLLSA